MNRQIAAIIIAGVVLLGSLPAFAGVTTGDTTPTNTTVIENETVRHNSDNTHRVVTGYAKKKLAPNFLDNDWDTGSFGNLTSAEKNYLRGITHLANGVHYYIDLTTGTMRKGNAFSNTGYQKTGEHTDRVTSTIRVDGGYLTVHQDTTHVYYERDVYQIVADVYDSSPLVLDLNGDGKLDVAKNEWQPHAPKFYTENARFFDITGDGTVDFTEWVSVGAGDGILVRPENGKVETALQLFGTAGGYTDGYEKLSLVQDSDNNGWVEGQELEGLYLWVDANSDGKMQNAELRNLSEFGIKKIGTAHRNFVGSYVTNDGAQHVMWDWWPATKETRKFRAQ